MSTAAVRALGYLEIGVSDMSAWPDFARNILGVACEAAGDALHLRYDDDCWRLRLVPTGEDDVRCAGFDVGDEATLNAIRGRLEAQGIAVTEASASEAAARGVTRLWQCAEPFGLRVEFYVGDRTVPTPFVSPRNVGGFLTGEQGLGHMVLAVGDAERAEAFYVNGLGFRLSDHILMGPPGRQLRLTFLHCNPRHHTIALAPVPAPKRLNHIMLQLRDLDDVGYGLDAARAAGIDVTSTLGKHTNDLMLSFYMASPSGFEFEYGYGGREIDDATWHPEVYTAPSLWGHKGRLNR